MNGYNVFFNMYRTSSFRTTSAGMAPWHDCDLQADPSDGLCSLAPIRSSPCHALHRMSILSRYLPGGAGDLPPRAKPPLLAMGYASDSEGRRQASAPWREWDQRFVSCVQHVLFLIACSVCSKTVIHKVRWIWFIDPSLRLPRHNHIQAQLHHRKPWLELPGFSFQAVAKADLWDTLGAGQCHVIKDGQAYVGEARAFVLPVHAF